MDFNNETWTTVANRALAALGREPLEDIDQAGSDAALARQSLPEAISNCAGYFDWSFLRKTQRLSKDETTDGTPFRYAYTIPSDAMRVQRVDVQDCDFSIESGRVYTDAATCTVTYMRLPASGPVQGAPAFNTAVQHYLAFLMAKALTGSDAIVQTEYQLFQTWIEKATLNDRAYLSRKGERWWTEEIYG